MARKMTEWPSKSGPITKIMPSDGCIGDTVPLAVGKWYDFHEFGWYMGNAAQGFGPAGYPTRPVDSYQIKPTPIWVELSSTGGLRRWGALGNPG